jgi:arylsulfatase A-like enzyme
MNRRTFLRQVGVGTGAMALPAFLRTGVAAETTPPNIIIIMADDMGYSDIGCYGGEVKTPNLDRLAAGGVRFTQFYNAARCCPTRASLLTGLYPHQAGVGAMVGPGKEPGYRGRLNESCVTIAEVLGGAGYTTLMSGKYHVTHYNYSDPEPTLHRDTWPIQRGFDRFFGTLAGGGSYYHPVSLMEDNDFIEPPEGFYYTDAISDHAAQFITEAPAEKPFFLYTAYTAPHWPLHALKEDIEKYKEVYRVGWDNIREQRRERMIKMGLIRPEWPLTERDERIEVLGGNGKQGMGNPSHGGVCGADRPAGSGRGTHRKGA